MQTIGTLKPHPPYNLALTLNLLSRYTHPSLDVAHKGAYWRLIYGKRGCMSLVRVRDASKSDKKPKLQVDLMLSTAPPDTDEVMQHLAHIMGTDIDPVPFYQHAREHKRLWRVIKPLRGLRWLRTETVFEALMLTIIEQQINWQAAQRAQRWLVAWGGHQLSHRDRTYFAFPRPRQLSRASIDALRPLKITFRRMQTMIDISRAVVDGTLDLEGLRHQSPEAAYQALTAIKGVGHWTAAWTLQRTLPHHNVVGSNDVALQAAVGRYFFDGANKVSRQQVDETFAAYGDYAALAANYTIMRYVLDRYPAAAST